MTPEQMAEVKAAIKDAMLDGVRYIDHGDREVSGRWQQAIKKMPRRYCHRAHSEALNDDKAEVARRPSAVITSSGPPLPAWQTRSPPSTQASEPTKEIPSRRPWQSQPTANTGLPRDVVAALEEAL